jgi:hypothetical protein
MLGSSAPIAGFRSYSRVARRVKKPASQKDITTEKLTGRL